MYLEKHESQVTILKTMVYQQFLILFVRLLLQSLKFQVKQCPFFFSDDLHNP